MKNPLIVPIHLEAICIGGADVTNENAPMQAVAMSTFQNLPFKDVRGRNYPYDASPSMRGSPFVGDLYTSFNQASKVQVLEAGVHLHWALPKALVRGKTVYRIDDDVLDDLTRQGVPQTLSGLLTPATAAGSATALRGALERLATAANPSSSTLAEQTKELIKTGDVAAGDALILDALNSAAQYAQGEGAGSLLAKLVAAVDSGAYTAGQLQVVMAAAAAADPAMLGKPTADVAASWLFYTELVLKAAARMELPPIPDRWLLVRLPGAGGNLKAGAWVIESDYLSPPFATWQGQNEKSETAGQISQQQGTYDGTFGNYKQLAVPDTAMLKTLLKTIGDIDYVSQGELPYKYLGRCRVSHADLAEDTTANRWGGDGSPRLTAVGYGEPAFAAFYPNCREVLGHYDDVSDVKDAERLSYVVVGWHSRAADDPLNGPLDDADLASVLNALGWTGTDGNHPPAGVDGTLYAGLVSGISWDPKRGSWLSAESLDVDVAVGNSAAEALAAWLANKAANKAEETGLQWRGLTGEDLLMAVHTGLASQLAGPDGPAQLESALHQQSFVPVDGGRLWSIAARDSKRTPTSTDFGQVTLDDADAHTLNALNQAQFTYDRLRRIIAGQREQLFSDTQTFLLNSYGAHVVDAGAKIRAQKLIKDTTNSLYELTQTQLPAAAAAVTAALADTQAVAAKVNGVVQSRPAPRFWRPADPVVLLVGADVAPAAHFTPDEESAPGGLLVCRVPTQIVTSATVDPNEHGSFAAQPPPVPVPAMAPAPDVITSLLQEAVLLDQAIASARSGAAPAGGPPPISPAAGAVLPAPLALNVWADGADTTANPWHPLFLCWSGQFKPLDPYPPASDLMPYATDFLAAHSATLDANDIDLTCGDNKISAGMVLDFRGLTILSSRAVSTLDDRLQEFQSLGGSVPDGVKTAVKNLLNALPAGLADVTALSQSLHGFNQSLLTRRTAYQLPPVDPLSPGGVLVKEWITGDNTLTAAWQIGRHTLYSPLPLNDFAPLRAGFATFSGGACELSVIDAFGQTRTVPPSNTQNVVRSRGMQPELDSKHESDLDPSLPSPTDICLRPRLIPPIRMLFRWLSADPAHDDMETNASPATSPVCGWVVHNRLDESLEIFDATGVSLGSLRVEGTAVAWAPPLGSGQQAGGKFSSVTAARAAIASGTGANANGHVLDLAAALATYESDRFNDFCEQLDAALRATAPPARQHDAAMAPLVSQPLALVRAALRLELSELPAVSQSNSSFDALPDPEDDSKEWDVLPKWDPLSEAPGLGNDSAPTFTARYTRGFEKVTFQARLGDASLDEDGLAWCFTPEGGSSDFNSGGGPGVQIPLTCDPGTTPRDVIVAMLIDPRASVHAATGVVPMKAIDIPPDQYRPAMQKITVSFLATPVLLPPDRVQLPLPGAAHHRWRWLSQSSPGHWDTCTEPRPQASGSQAAAPPPGAGSLIRGVDDRAHLSTSRSAPVRVVEGWLQSEILDEGD